MNKRLLLLVTTALMLLASCHRDKHFITDTDYREQVHKDFLSRQQLAEGRSQQLFSCMDTLKCFEKEAMEFLYAYMPYSDLADYDGEFFLKQMRYAFKAQETFSWGKQVPEDIFRHFVLPYRVNNENLDTARMYMFSQLKDRIKDLSMHDAALEVNHWCHEYVAYRAADARTSAPLATMRTSLGRCGEESTFAVTAFRSVGIPARQCYTPRWAHCDDNHAWVEVWVDGEWYFLGACEPDAELNMGWFSVPSTRCMMVHTKAFGRYHGDEEVVKESFLFSELNLLSHYAPTKHITITVKNADESIAPKATVDFKLYNYSEYYTLASVKTNNEGKASLTTGLGDLLIWATDGTQYAYSKMDVRTTDTLTLYLTRSKGETPSEYVEEFTIVPPAAGEAKVTVSPEVQAKNDKRIAIEDSIREAYMATFPTRNKVDSYIKNNANLDAAQKWNLIHTAEGNYQEVANFINAHQEKEDGLFLNDYLLSYSEKDLRDTPQEIFDAQLTTFSTLSGYPLEVYKKGIMPARISNELVRDWRHFLAEKLQQELRLNGVNELISWVKKNLSVDAEGNYYNCPISPRGVFELRYCDAHSRDIFFVAACRSMDIPSYLDNGTGIIYVWNNEQWCPVSLDNSAAPDANTFAQITLTWNGKEPATPEYYVHYTLEKFVDGDFESYDFEGDPRVENMPATLSVEPGYYLLSTGLRNSEGTVASRLEFFNVLPNARISKEIVLNAPQTTHKVLGQLSPSLPIMDGVSLEEYVGEKGMIMCFMGDYREPSKHLAKELQEHRSELSQWGGSIWISAPQTAGVMAWKLPNVDYVPSVDTPLEKSILKALKIDLRNDYPLMVAVNHRGEVLYWSHGYKIGSAELALKSVK